MHVLFGGFVRVHVSFRPRRREPESLALPEGATVQDLLEAVGQPIDGTVAVRAGRPVPEDAPLVDGDEIVLLSSFSGG